MYMYFSGIFIHTYIGLQTQIYINVYLHICAQIYKHEIIFTLLDGWLEVFQGSFWQVNYFFS